MTPFERTVLRLLVIVVRYCFYNSIPPVQRRQDLLRTWQDDATKALNNSHRELSK